VTTPCAQPLLFLFLLLPFLAKEATFGRLSEEERGERKATRKKKAIQMRQVTSRSFFSLSNAKEEET
jgi:hypothetical protein